MRATTRGLGISFILLIGTAVSALTIASVRPQSVTWTRARVLTGLLYHAMAFDARRERVVLFGGRGNGGVVADTWEWDGTAWTQRITAASPGLRTGHAMVYDAARQRVVLFGGADRGGSTVLSDTWEWDGTSWQQRLPARSPPARQSHALAYDAARQRVVLFGGWREYSIFEDTWEWDGNDWTEQRPAGHPKARMRHAMTYDPAGGRVVLFGGYDGSDLADTWTFDGSTWTQVALTGPSPRYWCGMAYDAARRRVVLHGGTAAYTVRSDTWEWDGLVWRLQPASGPTRSGHWLAYDVARQSVVLFGGYDGTATWPPDTWTFDGARWTRPSMSEAPNSRFAHAMVYDRARQRIVMVGGSSDAHSGGSYLDETWEWDNRGWSLRRPATSPGGRVSLAIAYDASRQRVVLFGGRSPFGLLADTWEWDGTAWLQRTPPTSPAPRTEFTLAYDGARQRTVLFGGSLAANSALGDTWEWDGAAWVQRTPSASPPPRHSHAMQYDSARSRLVLFGGFSGASALGDTWEWDGTTWTQRAATGPAPGGDMAMAFDESRQRIVLFCGGTSAPSAATLEWDGSTWTQRTPANAPEGRLNPAMAYDASAQRIVMFGGRGSFFYPVTYGDTWLYGTLGQPAAAVIGAACAGTNGLPLLAGNEPYLGAPGFALDLLSARSASPCAFGFSLGTQSLAIGGGCTLYLQAPIAVVLAATDSIGFASIRFSVPPDPTLRGATLYAQAFVADPQGAAGGLAVTSGRRLVVGD